MAVENDEIDVPEEVKNDEIDVPEEVKNSLEVTPKLAEAFPEAITLSEALNCRICRSHIKTPMLTKCKIPFQDSN